MITLGILTLSFLGCVVHWTVHFFLGLIDPTSIDFHFPVETYAMVMVVAAGISWIL